MAKLTVRAYNTDLRIFEEFLTEKYGDEEILPSRQDVSEFMEHSRNEGCADTTVARRLVSIKAYSRYLAIAGHTPEDVTEVMLSPKTWKRVPECLSIQQMRSILELWNDPQDVISLRNRAILEILYASGIRVAELCTLKANAVNFQDGILKVMGKGSKERMVPCSEAAIGALSAYLKVREQLKPRARENALFLGRQGTQINRRSVYEIVRTSGIQAGIGDGVHPHLLRHSFATHLLANGADLRAIQEMLGHASISTTQIYTHADTSRLKDAFNKFFPRA